LQAKSKARALLAWLGWISAAAIAIVGVWAERQRPSFPQLYKSCESPDGSWTVEIYRVWRGGVVQFWAEAALRDGSASSETIFETLDMWEDAEDRYPELICDDAEARLERADSSDAEQYRLIVPKPRRGESTD